MKDLILIGGAAGSGKTTLAKRLAEHYGVPWISTDQIRSILEVEDEDHMVRLKKTWKGTLGLVKHYHPWEGAIIEGTAILPECIAQDLKEDDHVKVLFLRYSSEEEILKVIEERSKLPWINTKTEEQKKRKANEVSEFNEMIIETAHQYKYSCIQGSEDALFESALSHLKY